jgi:hypothetical protein
MEWADDERFAEDPVAVVREIQREAFAAGFAAGSDTAADGVVGHADALGSQRAVSVNAAVPRGLQALAVQMRELGRDARAAARALREAGGAP